ncbi:MAG: sulfatase-like hydrolase/transferase [Thermoanaerobaculia bacterium]
MRPVLLSLLLLGGSARAAAAPPANSVSPNVLLITVDTLRPDALGWVAGRNHTPALDALASAGFRFPAAVAAAPLTLPSHASLFTGDLPRRHGVRDNGQVLGRSPATLADLLAARGYTTAGFVSGYPLRRQFGIDRGFQHFDDRLPAGPEGFQDRPAPATSAAALAWIAQARAPWFVWIHYYDPHDPYSPPPAFRRPGPRGAYDGEVAFTDAGIGGLRKGLPRTRPLLTIFAGDHGEGLMDHGEEGHGYFVYDSTITVPLVFSYPGRIKPGASRAAARLIDVLPTVLSLLGLPVPAGLDGLSLVPTLSGDPQSIPPAYVESLQPWLSFGWAPLKAIRSGDWKFVSAPQPELYDLSSDPGETRNLVASNRSKLMELIHEQERVEALPAVSAARVADPEAVARLRSLGYLGSGHGDREPPRDLPDPKSRLRERTELIEAENLFRNGDLPGALRAFDAVLKSDPRNRFAVSRSGLVLLKKGNAREAIPRLERAVAIDPEEAESQFGLAFALGVTGRLDEALPHWLETVRLQPKRSMAWTNLGMVLARLGKRDEALKALQHASELEPANPLFLANLGVAERDAGRSTDALAHLRKSAELSNGRFPYSGTLGLLLATRAPHPEAMEWLRRSRHGEPDCAEAHLALARMELESGHPAAARDALAFALVENPALRPRASADAALAPLLR